MSKFILASPLLLIAFPAFAYLDPGSGNALVYLLVSLFGAVTYFLKSAFYRVLGFIRGEKIETQKNDEIVIFSEGKSYWLTFKPIIEEFIKRNIPFTYLTMDVRDPALTIEHDCMHSKYVGDGAAGFSKVAHSKGPLMLATTPNIGTEGFPLPRPKNIKCLAHIWHSVCDTSFYHLGALDHYDTALAVGDCFIPSIRLVEEKRSLKPKEVISVGLPYLDELKKNTLVDTSAPLVSNKTILVAPSWGSKNCLAFYGWEFLKQLAAEGFNVIVRPHPQSLKVEMDFFQQIKKDVESYKNIVFDFEIDGSASMRKADLLISDKSSIRFDFAFLYERPVLTLDIPLKDLSMYEASLIGSLWEEEHSEQLGLRLQLNEKEKIIESVKQALQITPMDIQKFRSNTIKNWEHSAEAIVDWSINKVELLRESK